MQNKQGKEEELRFVHYFLHAKKHNIDYFINLLEENLCKDFVFWPYTEILREGHVLKDVNPITAWKSEKDDINIIVVEDQAYKYEYKFIALYSCPENKGNQIKKIFNNIDEELKKIKRSKEKKLADEKVIKWVNEHKFILQIFGITGITGSVLWLLFSRDNKQDHGTVLDTIIILLSKIIPLLLLLGMLIFLIIMYARIFRIISRK